MSLKFEIAAVLSFIVAFAAHYLNFSLATFIFAALALVLLSKILGDATEQLSLHVGERVAGLVNVTLSNLAELIIIFVAIKSDLIELVQGGIVGSIVGNLLLVLGCSIYFGCKKHGRMVFNEQTRTLFINQFFLVAVTLLLPTLFGARIPQERQQIFNDLLACVLAAMYFYFYRLSLKDTRFHKIEEQAYSVEFRWRKTKTLSLLTGTAIGVFFMSEFLIGEVEPIAKMFDISQLFIGFILLPILGNLAEHSVAIVAARKGMTELSLAVAVGSASQVGMIVAPAAVFFGTALGNPVTLNFASLPYGLLIVSFVGTFLVLRDGELHQNEGVMLLALYLMMVIAFAFSQ